MIKGELLKLHAGVALYQYKYAATRTTAPAACYWSADQGATVQLIACIWTSTLIL
jgi:hypothetical protein